MKNRKQSFGRCLDLALKNTIAISQHCGIHSMKVEEFCRECTVKYNLSKSALIQAWEIGHTKMPPLDRRRSIMRISKYKDGFSIQLQQEVVFETKFDVRGESYDAVKNAFDIQKRKSDAFKRRVARTTKDDRG